MGDVQELSVSTEYIQVWKPEVPGATIVYRCVVYCGDGCLAMSVTL